MDTFDSCGALDLSSATSASSGCNSTKVSDEEYSDHGMENGSTGGTPAPIGGKRKSGEMEGGEGLSGKRKRSKSDQERRTELEFTEEKVRALNKRRNIRDVLSEDMLTETTRKAQADEEERLQRLRQQDALTKEDLMATSEASDENKGMSDTVEEEEEDEDPNNSGMHVNDALNTREADGRVLINTQHPKDDPDIYLAPQLAAAIKPHQIGGVRFLYDNIVESVNRFSTSQGYGCILAHSMGLGE